MPQLNSNLGVSPAGSDAGGLLVDVRGPVRAVPVKRNAQLGSQHCYLNNTSAPVHASAVMERERVQERVPDSNMLNEVFLLREELTHARAALARGAVEAKAAEARAAHAAEAWRVERDMMVAEMARARLEASRSVADVKLCEVEEWRAPRGVPVAELVCKRVDALWSAPDLMSHGVRLAPEMPSRVALDICQNVTNRVFDPGTGLRKL